MRRTALPSQLFARKSIDKLIRDSEEPEHALKKSLGPWSLTALGIGAFLKFYQRFRKHLHTVEVFSGVLLLLIGALVFMNRLTWLSGKLAFLNKFSL